MADASAPKPRLIILLGPTGSGKTALALRLAGRFGGEIVSADSMQVYRGMDIGTAKPTSEERRAIRHHLLDVVAPDAAFDVSRYCELARTAIAELHGAGKRVFVVGGTGLYLRALEGGLIEGPAADEALRQSLKEEMKRLGKPHLYETLRGKDPLAAAQIHPQDGIRMVRALEVLELTGRSIVEHQRAHRFRERPYEILKIGLMPERERLWTAIEARTEGMIARGFVDEVRNLLAQGYDGSVKAMQSLGYRHLVAHLAGKGDLADAVQRIKHDTRRYAKRQLTWFTADSEVLWQDPGDEAGAAERIDRFLANPQRT